MGLKIVQLPCRGKFAQNVPWPISQPMVLVCFLTGGNTPARGEEICHMGVYGVRKGTVRVRVWVHKSRIAGLGLFAAQEIKHGTRILPYLGEKIDKDESTRRIAQGNAYIFTFN